MILLGKDKNESEKETLFFLILLQNIDKISNCKYDKGNKTEMRWRIEA